MSTGNDPALPADNQPKEPNAADAAVAAAAADGAGEKDKLTFLPDQPVDVDDVELNEAQTAAQAEKAADGANGQGASTGTDPAQAPPKATPSPDPPAPGREPQPQPQPEPPMIPKARFDEVNKAKSDAEQLAAYWRGVAEARNQPAPEQPAANANPQPPTPEQQLSELHAKQDALAAQFDNGEITMAEFKKQERELAQHEAKIREDQLAAKLKPAAAPQDGNELYLETLTANLEKEHLWVQPFNAVATEAEWDFVAQRARESLAARGVELKGAIGSYELRKEISVLIDRLAPTLIADRANAAQQAGVPFPGAKPSPAAAAQPPNPPGSAQDRLKALHKAANAPPDLTAMRGHNPDAGGEPSEARIEAMTDEEIGALPPTVRNKLLGITA